MDTDEVIVPVRDAHDQAPCADEDIVWQYLLPEARMRRCTETIEILDLRRAHRQITIDFSLPGGAREPGSRWLIPAALLGKTPVAPDLEVRDSSGGIVSIPTKRENMALTVAALDRLNSAGAIDFSVFPELRDLARQVITSDIFEARVARRLAEGAMGPEDTLLRALLRSLEDRFLLWIPVQGTPGCDQQLQIFRRQRFSRDDLWPRSRIRDQRQVDTALGSVNVELMAARGRRRFKLRVAIARAQLFFGLAPIEYRQEVAEARRFASFHLRVLAPDGLVVRSVGLEVPKAGTADLQEPEMEEAESEPGLIFQGRDSEMGHLHCSREVNPASLVSLTTFGIRDGLTTLWAGAVVFTALLLWAVHRLAPPDLLVSGNGQLEATVAVLLVGPALAAAWAIRSDSELVERSLLGARTLLLASALLAVVAALSLAGLRPFRWTNDQAIELYASLSYLVAVAIVVGWVVTLPPTWFFYREVLTDARRNLATVVLICLIGIGAAAHPALPMRLVGFALLGAGLALAAVAAHPGRSSRTDDRGSGPVIAGVGAIGMLIGAGFFLGYYEELVSTLAFRPALCGYVGLVALVALAQRWRLP